MLRETLQTLSEKNPYKNVLSPGAAGLSPRREQFRKSLSHGNWKHEGYENCHHGRWNYKTDPTKETESSKSYKQVLHGCNSWDGRSRSQLHAHTGGLRDTLSCPLTALSSHRPVVSPRRALAVPSLPTTSQATPGPPRCFPRPAVPHATAPGGHSLRGPTGHPTLEPPDTPTVGATGGVTDHVSDYVTGDATGDVTTPRPSPPGPLLHPSGSARAPPPSHGGAAPLRAVPATPPGRRLHPAGSLAGLPRPWPGQTPPLAAASGRGRRAAAAPPSRGRLRLASPVPLPRRPEPAAPMPSSEAVPLGLGACRRSGALAGMLALVARLLEWLRSLFWKEEMELTLVGLQYSGKTTFVNVIAVSGPRGAEGSLRGL